MGGSVVTLDACVLYPAPLRDFLMHLAVIDLFRAKWTDAIHSEWIMSVLQNRPDLSLKQLERTRNLMNSHVRDCLVEGYEGLVETINLPDKDDRHVLAAAIHSRANVILTFNLKDFPSETLQPYGIETKSPDQFIVSLLDTNFEKVFLAAEQQRLNLKNPPKTSEEFLQILRRQNLKETCNRLEELP